MRSFLYINHFIYILSLTGSIAASIIPKAYSIKATKTLFTKRKGPTWPYGVIGDSWGSSVAYKDEVLFDQNLDNCLRTKESHGPQLEADSSWIGDFSSGLRDAACSGSRLVDLAKGDYQMGKVGNSNVVVMTTGGNDCGFGVIVDKCIYHSNPARNYGPAYADDYDQTGDCALGLNKASDYIADTLQEDLIKTINDILIDPNVKSNPDYNPWCNDEAWNIAGISPTPYLSVELRTAFNDRISQLNKIFSDTVQQRFSQEVRFVDLDAGFSGHRFCEPGATHADQLNTDTDFDGVYLWNLNWPWQVANTSAPEADENGGKITAQEAQGLFGGNGVTAWSGSGSGGNTNVPSNGWRLRPFHPRTSGYTSIKNAITAQLKADGLSKAQSQSVSTIAPSQTPTTSSVPGPVVTDYCNTAHRIVFDEFDIKGVDFDESKFQGGDGLKTQISGCGKLTDWKFNGNLNDPTFKWEANGHLPIGTQDCVQSAITSAGGPDHEHCSGTS